MRPFKKSEIFWTCILTTVSFALQYYLYINNELLYALYNIFLVLLIFIGIADIIDNSHKTGGVSFAYYLCFSILSYYSIFAIIALAILYVLIWVVFKLNDYLDK